MKVQKSKEILNFTALEMIKICSILTFLFNFKFRNNQIRTK